MSYLLEVLQARKPRTLRVCTLLHKPARERIKVPIHHCGFTIDDVFVVGYGLDFQQRYRDLPFIGVMHFDDEPADDVPADDQPAQDQFADNEPAR